MLSKKKIRRMAGFIVKYFSDSVLEIIEDPRSKQGRRWKSCLPFIKAVMLGLACGCNGLKDVEKITNKLPTSLRKILGIRKRLSDTTVRDFLVKIEPEEIIKIIYIIGYDAFRRKALMPIEGFDFGIISMDGKYPSIKDTSEYKYLQVHHDKDGEAIYGTLRTITSTLITSKGRPILGAQPVLGSTNEQGGFQKAFGEMVRVYGKLFKLVMYDAGAASLPNADAVKSAGKEYFFQIADPRWHLYKNVSELLANKEPDWIAQEQITSKKSITRELTIMSVENLDNSSIWNHTKTIIKVYSEIYENKECTGSKSRYFVTSLKSEEFPAEKWLQLVIMRWGVETSHQILDTAFLEDKRLWIRANAQGCLAVMLFRRAAYTILTLFKSVTLRSESNRNMTWKSVMEWVMDTLKWPIDEDFKGLRLRKFSIPKTLA